MRLAASWERALGIEARQTVAAEDLRDLASVMDVVLQHVPDDPAAMMCPRRSMGAGRSDDGPREVVGIPASKAVVDDRPRPCEPVHQLPGASRVVVDVLPPGVVERQTRDGRSVDAEEVAGRRVALAEDVVEPVRSRTGDVRGQLPDGPLVRG